jgi:hypothetical protein
VADKSGGRRAVDPLVLIAAPATLLVAAYVLTDGSFWVGSATRWVLAGGAVLVGLLLLGRSRSDRRRRDQ